MGLLAQKLKSVCFSPFCFSFLTPETAHPTYINKTKFWRWVPFITSESPILTQIHTPSPCKPWPSCPLKQLPVACTPPPGLLLRQTPVKERINSNTEWRKNSTDLGLKTGGNHIRQKWKVKIIGTTDDTDEQNQSVMNQRQGITGDKCTAALRTIWLGINDKENYKYVGNVIMIFHRPVSFANRTSSSLLSYSTSRWEPYLQSNIVTAKT